MKKREVKETEKYVTEKVFKKTFNNFEARFESSARATAKSFADTAETMAMILAQLKNINEVTTTMLKEIRIIHEDNKYFRQSISALNTNDFSSDRKIEDLTMRVEKLEQIK